mmetsp:Transcript_154557/g.280889  ORF Transcript_154557/g.280889 Transcript_154557/m.280889 type:complete len:270 (+) Transcript_154557:191-1000(+)
MALESSIALLRFPAVGERFVSSAKSSSYSSSSYSSFSWVPEVGVTPTFVGEAPEVAEADGEAGSNSCPKPLSSGSSFSKPSLSTSASREIGEVGEVGEVGSAAAPSSGSGAPVADGAASTSAGGAASAGAGSAGAAAASAGAASTSAGAAAASAGATSASAGAASAATGAASAAGGSSTGGFSAGGRDFAASSETSSSTSSGMSSQPPPFLGCGVTGAFFLSGGLIGGSSSENETRAAVGFFPGVVTSGPASLLSGGSFSICCFACSLL